MNPFQFILQCSMILMVMLVSAQGIHEKDQNPVAIDTTIVLDEVLVSNEITHKEAEAIKNYIILQRRVYRTYPFAKTAVDRLTELRKTLEVLKTDREKKKYIKIVEQYLKEEFEPQLKNLSQKDGQILVKLISRQSGESTYELIRNLKSGWKAFWSNRTASLFNINLKTEYNPLEVEEDYMIENILLKAFTQRLLIEQKPAKPIDIYSLYDKWNL